MSGMHATLFWMRWSGKLQPERNKVSVEVDNPEVLGKIAPETRPQDPRAFQAIVPFPGPTTPEFVPFHP